MSSFKFFFSLPNMMDTNELQILSQFLCFIEVLHQLFVQSLHVKLHVQTCMTRLPLTDLKILKRNSFVFCF